MTNSAKRGGTKERVVLGNANASKRRSYVKPAGFTALGLAFGAALVLLSGGHAVPPKRAIDKQHQPTHAQRELAALQRRFGSVLTKAVDDATQRDMAAESSAVVTLPRHANEPFHLTDRSSGLALEVRLQNAPAA